MSHRLYRAYWIEGQNIADRSVLNAIAVEGGVDPKLVDDPSARAGLFETTDAAVQHGAFGVPAFVVDGTLWWGQDRLLSLVEHATKTI